MHNMIGYRIYQVIECYSEVARYGNKTVDFVEYIENSKKSYEFASVFLDLWSLAMS